VDAPGDRVSEDGERVNRCGDEDVSLRDRSVEDVFLRRKDCDCGVLGVIMGKYSEGGSETRNVGGEDVTGLELESVAGSEGSSSDDSSMKTLVTEISSTNSEAAVDPNVGGYAESGCCCGVGKPCAGDGARVDSCDESTSSE
jgi:hypothetical protein